MTELIRLEDVSRIYRSEDVETAALSGVTFTISQGEFVAITGPSGCGKSTLLNVLGTVDQPSDGRYFFKGENIAGQSESRLTQIRRDHIGFVFQSFNLIDELTIAENVELGLAYRRRDRKNDGARVRAAMERVNIEHRAKHFPHQLSGGQQQRAAIARAIVGDPDVILADEPTGNLDSKNGEQVMEILRGLNASGATIVMVTHSPQHAQMATRQIRMLDGRARMSSDVG